jgi:hypothetical protein
MASLVGQTVSADSCSPQNLGAWPNDLKERKIKICQVPKAWHPYKGTAAVIVGLEINWLSITVEPGSGLTAVRHQAIEKRFHSAHFGLAWPTQRAIAQH